MHDNQIDQRLRDLERKCHMQQRMFLLIFGVGLVIVAGGWFNQLDIQNVVRARRMEVVNKDGAVVWTLGATPDGNGVAQLFNAQGQVVWVALAAKDGAGSTALFNSDGKSIWAAGVNKGHGLMQVSHANGQVRWWATVDEEGNGISKVWDKEGNEVWTSSPQQ